MTDNKGKSKELRCLRPEEYTVGWICALPTELIAAKAMLDETHAPLESQPKSDENNYILGSIGKHNIVIACLPEYGVVPAAVVAKSMQNTFSGLRFGLMVGIGGGVPSAENDIRLGDIVVSLPTGQGGGVIQYDLGQIEADGFQRLGMLNKPPTLLRAAIPTMRSTRTLSSEISALVNAAFGEYEDDEEEWTYPQSAKDILFDARFAHVAKAPNCNPCAKNTAKVVKREKRKNTNPRTFYGNIASGNSVVKNAIDRDRLAERDNVICFEMEAAGLMDNFPCLVIRGISDYADSHKNWKWQPYAAAVAAAYAKKLLFVITPEQVGKLDPIRKNRHWIIPRPCNPHFTGREDILTTLRERLCGTNNNSMVARQKRFVIFGMGGAGKSEVCLKFAEENRECFWGIFWVDAGSVTNIKSGFIDAASKAAGGKEKTYEDAKHWFENLDKTWLLILDNADNIVKTKSNQASKVLESSAGEDSQEDVVIDYSAFLPSGDRGSVLITTRNEDCAMYGSDGFQRFEKLEIKDSVPLLLKAAGIEEAKWEQSREDAMKIVGENCLTQHALAIVQAGAFIKQGLCKLKDYPAEFKRQRKLLLEHRPDQAKSVYGDVYATFEVSAQTMNSSSKQEWEDAFQLLKVLAFLDRQNVPKEMFDKAWNVAMHYCELSEHDLEARNGIEYHSMWQVNCLLNVLHPRPSTRELDQVSQAKARRALQIFSLITIHPETEGISMHPLVHAWARDRLAPEEHKEAWSTASSILSLSIESLDYQDFFNKIQSHIVFCIGPHPEQAFATENVDGFEICRIFYRFEWLLLHMGNGMLAEKIANLLTSRVGLGTKHNIRPHSRNWRNAMYSLAACQRHTGKYEQAMQLLKEVVRYDESSLTPNNPNRLNALGVLADAHLNLGQDKEAIRLLEEIIETRKKDLTLTNQIDLLGAQRTLARAYISDRQLEKAIKLLDAVVEAHKIISSLTHPDLLASQHTLAVAYTQNHQFQEAINLLKEVVKARKIILSSTHPNLLASQHELAVAYYQSGQYHKAVPIIRAVVKIDRNSLQRSDRKRIVSEDLLSYCLSKMGQEFEDIDHSSSIADLETGWPIATRLEVPWLPRKPQSPKLASHRHGNPNSTSEETSEMAQKNHFEGVL